MMMVLGADAQQVYKASEVMQAISGHRANKAPAVSFETEPFLVYSYGTAQKGAFQIVSTINGTQQVLAYSDNKSFDIENIPTNMTWWLEECVAYCQQQSEADATVRLRAEGEEANGVAQMLTTTWNQNNPFNYRCPMYNDVHTVTGCVPTAMAQAMNYYRHPAVGTGLCEYVTDTHKFEINEDLSTMAFKWGSMIRNYDWYSTPENDDAVAELMYACGVAVGADYCTANEGGTSSSLLIAAQALAENFGYDEDMVCASRDYMKYEDWERLLVQTLDAGHPVLYGANSATSGHCFIFDGYETVDGTVYYHVNWGWGGMDDGYYRVLHLQPETAGIGGSAHLYDSNHEALLNFKPDNGINEGGTMLEMKSLKFDADEISLGTTSVKYIMEDVYNFAVRTFSGELRLYLVDSEGNRMLVSRAGLSDVPYCRGYAKLSANATLPADLPEGVYTAEMTAIMEGTDVETPVYFLNDAPTLRISSSASYKPSVMMQSMTVKLDEANNVEVGLGQVMNYAAMTFTGVLRLAIADTEGNVVERFGTEFPVNGLEHFSSYRGVQTLKGTIPSTISNGRYRLYAVANQTGYDDWAFVEGYTVEGNYITDSGKEVFADLWIKNGKAYADDPFGDDDGIEEIAADELNSGAIYNLNGQRVSSLQLSRPQVVIKDGKKILKK